jgi:hypothetical protein
MGTNNSPQTTMAALASRPWARFGLKLTTRTGLRHGTTWARTPTRRVFWAFPLAGGLTLCLAPPINSLVCTILTPPAVISCSDSPRRTQPIILSPSESDQSIFNRIVSVLQANVWEPILTATRFIYLFILFIPVIVSSPLLLVGPPEEGYGGDRWGAVAWYSFLVSRMEAAGPTFIKVCSFLPLLLENLTASSWLNGLHRVQIFSPLYFVKSWAPFIREANLTTCRIPNA